MHNLCMLDAGPVLRDVVSLDYLLEDIEYNVVRPVANAVDILQSHRLDPQGVASQRR